MVPKNNKYPNQRASAFPSTPLHAQMSLTFIVDDDDVAHIQAIRRRLVSALLGLIFILLACSEPACQIIWHGFHIFPMIYPEDLVFVLLKCYFLYIRRRRPTTCECMSACVFNAPGTLVFGSDEFQMFCSSKEKEEGPQEHDHPLAPWCSRVYAERQSTTRKNEKNTKKKTLSYPWGMPASNSEFA